MVSDVVKVSLAFLLVWLSNEELRDHCAVAVWPLKTVLSSVTVCVFLFICSHFNVVRNLVTLVAFINRSGIRFFIRLFLININAGFSHILHLTRQV